MKRTKLISALNVSNYSCVTVSVKTKNDRAYIKNWKDVTIYFGFENNKMIKLVAWSHLKKSTDLKNAIHAERIIKKIIKDLKIIPKSTESLLDNTYIEVAF